ncbi:3-isopropylmalate dehydratase small subunit [Pelomonas cellulosilytica]|uniref:3-isopropylmalate dehydratase small subunit n=1 Tax=Pelomonas cellulosilytica TaxID=2906762 RepID=A0ABS8XPM3_9BURK|nr:3-isopropylmalate dehydratase small subunit [Pelomonas sp. P8]MCE4552867.1 3-isopropylmalate dehydratase small subunit [Pelomonas sp. P8]
MDPFITHTGVAAALLRSNIDTDAIIPSREMKTVSKTGLAAGLFAGWRYVQGREPAPDFVLNRPEQRSSTILLAGRNFGCGSSREHAVWALKEYGIRAIVAPSFGAIFAANCVRNGLLPVVLSEAQVAALADSVEPDPQARPIHIDLLACTVTDAGGQAYAFELAASQRQMLLKGLDPIALTLESSAAIDAFQAADRQARPWIYLG